MKKTIGQKILEALPPRPDDDAGRLRAIAKYLDFADKLIVSEVIDNIEDELEREIVEWAFVGRGMQDDLERISKKVRAIDSIYLG